MQVLGIVAVAAWSGVCSGALWLVLKHLGWLRVTSKVEDQGLDHSQSIGTGVFGCLSWLRVKAGETEVFETRL